MNVGSACSGIGGFDLGFERAGMRTEWFCEQNEFCIKVLNHHWPDVPVIPDVRDINGDTPAVDLFCGGFPCQPFSLAGKGLAQADERHLWPEFARIIGELRPRWVVLENVPGLLGRGLDQVVGDLAEIGYDSEWQVISAAAAGAPHRRERVWIVAYPNADTCRLESDTESNGEPIEPRIFSSSWDDLDRFRDNVPDPSGVDGNARGGMGEGRVGGTPLAARGFLGDETSGEWPAANPWAEGEPAVDRMANGIPAQVDRLAALGNALIPQIAQWIGERIMTYEASMATGPQAAVAAPKKEAA